MTEKRKERIRRRMERFAKRETERQNKFASKIVRMHPARLEKKMAKAERKLAKYEDEVWLRKKSLRFAGGVVLSVFAVVYGVLWWVGVSIKSIWGAGLISAITFVLLLLIGSFMDVYRNAGKEDNDG